MSVDVRRRIGPENWSRLISQLVDRVQAVGDVTVRDREVAAAVVEALKHNCALEPTDDGRGYVVRQL